MRLALNLGLSLAMLALCLWLVYLRQVTGSWFGNAEFAQYNVTDSFTPMHILYAMMRDGKEFDAGRFATAADHASATA